MATSGVAMPARSASCCTVVSRNASFSLRGALITRAPVVHLAIQVISRRRLREATANHSPASASGQSLGNT